MTSLSLHRLIGIEPDNLLGFLALMGTMRALRAASVPWCARVHWDVDHPPIHPILTLSTPVARASLLDAISAGCDVLATHHSFDGQRKLDWTRTYARGLLSTSIPSDDGPPRKTRAASVDVRRGRADMLAALVSDAAAWNGRVTATPLCLQYGQGHQFFLERFATVPCQPSAPSLEPGSAITTPTAQETLELALFSPWRRVDKSPGFRWDPEEDRRYALRFGNPSLGGVPTVHGANRLAALGLAVFTVVPRSLGTRVRLEMIASRTNKRREVEISWPIWTCPASLDGVKALLSSPLLLPQEVDSARLAALSVHEVRRATRIKVGEFLSVTRASVVPSKTIDAPGGSAAA